MEKFKLMWQSPKKGHCDFCSAELDKKYWIHENQAGEQDFFVMNAPRWFWLRLLRILKMWSLKIAFEV